MRVPVEDFCQALAVPPEFKYQNAQGPGPREILEVLATESTNRVEDCETFFTALAFNALIGGTDAHAKNYSVLIDSTGARLAPLYDVASAIPYFEPRKLKLAMKIGSHYELVRIRPKDWDAVGELAGLGEGAYERVRRLAERVLQHLEETAEELRSRGVTDPIIGVLVEGIARNAEACANVK